MLVQHQVSHYKSSTKMKKLIGLEFTDSSTNLTACRVSFKVNLTTILCVIACFFIGITLGYIIFQSRHSEHHEVTHQNVIVHENPTSVRADETPIGASKDPELARRQRFIRNMVLDAWNAYVRYAWGYKGLEPVSRSYYTESSHYSSGLTIIQSLSTLWIMGLKEEYEYGRSWVDKFNVSAIEKEFKMRVAVPRYLGSMLAMYALTNDTMYLKKIRQLEKVIQPAFESSSGIPYNTLKPSRLTASGTSTYLTTAGAYNLEFYYLKHLIPGSILWKSLLKTRKTLKQVSKSSNGLYMESIDSSSASWNSQTATIQMNAQHYFDSLVKAYIQSNGTDLEAIQMYREAIDAAEKGGLISKQPKSGLVFSRDQISSQFDSYMQFEGCSLGAMLALGADAMEDQLASRVLSSVERRREVFQVYNYWHQAEAIVETCHAAANSTKTGMAPSRIYFDSEGKIKTEGQHDDGNITPELAESYFTLYRLTGEEKYREYAWELAHAIQRYCHVPTGGYTNLEDVERSNKHDHQPDDFIGATLKYLYMTFAEDDAYGLDDWIFNAAGQPLPMCG